MRSPTGNARTSLNTSSVDLSGIPIVDNHAHPLTYRQPEDAEAFRRTFSEAHSPAVAREHMGWTVYYRWALRQLGRVLGVDPTEEAILQRRSEARLLEYAHRLTNNARIAWLLLDEGYPPPQDAYPSAELQDALGVRIGPILRLETLLQELIARHESFEDVAGAFDRRVSRARADGYISLKTIAAYRTGLAIEEVGEDEAARAFGPVRQEAESGALRLRSKPLIDFFLRRALRHAADQHLPIQFHTGYGDPDLDLRLANPLHLRPIFEDPSLADVAIILLHESYPYTAEAAYLAVSYPNAYLDLAFTLPPLDRFELLRVTRIALGAAPGGKIMVSSDGVGIPEHYWLGAVRAREIVAQVLTEMVGADELDRETARTIGRMILHDNAVRVYSLSS